MIISDLKIDHLRSIKSMNLAFKPHFNFIIGPNGSGKTTILEAIYLLGCGHSFRSREIAPLITHGEDTMTVYARGYEQESISIQKSTHGATQIKLNHQFCHSTSQLAYALPIQIFYSDLFQFIDAGPTVRRSVLDWGLFHVKHQYFSIWKDYKRVLKQRNALLKTKASHPIFEPWDRQLSDLGDALDVMRSDYFEKLHEKFTHLLAHFSSIPCQLSYFKGWDKKGSGKSLFDILQEHLEADMQKQYTQYGAHQADILVRTEDVKAKYILSRGQQKLILFALKCAQAELLTNSCIFLIDDLAAELDSQHQTKILNYLTNTNRQIIITSTSQSILYLTDRYGDYESIILENC